MTDKQEPELTVVKKSDGYWHVDYVEVGREFHCIRLSAKEALTMAMIAVKGEAKPSTEWIAKAAQEAAELIWTKYCVWNAKREDVESTITAAIERNVR